MTVYSVIIKICNIINLEFIERNKKKTVDTLGNLKPFIRMIYSKANSNYRYLLNMDIDDESELDVIQILFILDALILSSEDGVINLDKEGDA